MMISRKALYKYASWDPVLNVVRRATLCRKIVVLMYHEVLRDSEDIDAWTVVREKDFIKQMNYLHSHFRIVSLHDAFEIIRKPVQTEKNIAVVTFDDGYAGNKNVVLPIVESLGIPITVFVSTGAVQSQTLYWYDRLIIAFQSSTLIDLNLEHFGLGVYRTYHHFKSEKRWDEIQRLLTDLKRLMPSVREEVVEHILEQCETKSIKSLSLAPLSIAEIKEMAKSKLVTFGVHSHRHSILTQLETDEIRESIEMSKNFLEEWIGRPVCHFAYPNGNYNKDVIGVLQNAEFISGFTTTPGLWKAYDTPFTIPRIGIGRYDSFEMFKVRISGVLI